MLLAHAIGSNANNCICHFAWCWLLPALPALDRRSNAQQQKPRNETAYFYLTLSTNFLSYMYVDLQSTLLRVLKYFVNISMLYRTRYTIEVGDKIKETGKKNHFYFHVLRN